MKAFMKLSALLAAMVLLLSATPAYGRSGKTMEIARQMKEQTDNTIDSVKSTVGSLNTDSLGETVVFEKKAGNTDYDSDGRDNGSWDTALLLPIFGVVLGILTPAAVIVLIAFFICQYRRQKARDRNDLIRQAIAMGYPLPEAFYRQEKPTSRLQSGIVWIGWGTGFMLLYFLFHSGTIWLPIGVIMIFIGVSRLAVYFITRRETQSEEKENCSTDA